MREQNEIASFKKAQKGTKRDLLSVQIRHTVANRQAKSGKKQVKNVSYIQNRLTKCRAAAGEAAD